MDILVVDDDPAIRSLLTTVLGELGFVRIAADGNQALWHVSQRVPDVAVLDVMMPETDGLTVLSKWRSTGVTRDLPVVLLTALDQQADEIEGFRVGADAYLTKPFEPQQLIDTIRSLVDGDADASTAPSAG